MYQNFSITPESKIILERLKHRWHGNYKMDFIEIGFEDVKLIYLIRDRDQYWGLLNMI
jgi:hypothetical protein